ncbi:hypothetical protein C804_04732 [Lachnospiraceae bacterium A4]|nr:hypothetical protein C804_04732 [Lachnospiraceae bacterium A4]
MILFGYKVIAKGYYDVIFIGGPTWLAYHNLIQCTQA